MLQIRVRVTATTSSVLCYADEAHAPGEAPAWLSLQIQMLISPETPSQTHPINIRPSIWVPAALASRCVPLTTC